MIGSRDPLDVRSEAIVSASEPKLLRTLTELHVGADAVHLFPRDAHAAAAPEPGGDPPDPSGPRAPDSRAAQDRDYFEVLARPALQRDVVDLSATPAVGVEQLVIEQIEAEIDRLRQFCPTFVRIMSGMALTAITMMTTRYTIPSALAIAPFVYSRM